LEAVPLSNFPDKENGKDTKWPNNNNPNGIDSTWLLLKNHIATNLPTEMSLITNKLLMLIMVNMILLMIMVLSMHGKEMEVQDLDNLSKSDSIN